MKKALVLSLAAVLGLGFASFAQTLSGSWDTTISIVPAPVVTLGIDSELVITYAVSGWSFTSDTVIDETGWLEQEFAVAGSLGAFTIGSALVFDPSAPAFTSWEVSGGLSLAGVTFDGTFTLEPGVTSLEIVASGTAGNVDVSAILNLGGADCSFDFSDLVIDISFPFCCAEISSEIAFNCQTGFEYVTFEAEGIELPGMTWVTLDALLTFTVDEKTLVISPSFDFGATACFDVYLSDPAELFGDIEVVGLGLECEIGGVSFIGVSYWGDGEKPYPLKGEYWEAYQIATTDDGCCGPFAFDITVYFLEGGAMLFDVAALEANMSIQIATQFTFSMGIELDFEATPAFTAWTLGFAVEW